MNRRLFITGSIAAGTVLALPTFGEAATTSGVTLTLGSTILLRGSPGLLKVKIVTAAGKNARDGSIRWVLRSTPTTVPVVNGYAYLPIASTMLQGAYDLSATYLNTTGKATAQVRASLLILSGQPKMVVPSVTIPYGQQSFPVSASIILPPNVPVPSSLSGIIWWNVNPGRYWGEGVAWTGGLSRSGVVVLEPNTPAGTYPLLGTYREWPLKIAQAQGTLTITP